MRCGTKGLITMATAALSGMAWAGDAQTSATAGSGGRQRDGTASATASYDGDIGFARTRSKSGRVNVARGIAVGFDRDGLSLSVSNAIAGRRGPAIATNFNLSIGLDGQVSHSSGLAVADGSSQRTVSAGGETHARRNNNRSTSIASGRSVFTATW